MTQMMGGQQLRSVRDNLYSRPVTSQGLLDGRPPLVQCLLADRDAKC